MIYKQAKPLTNYEVKSLQNKFKITPHEIKKELLGKRNDSISKYELYKIPKTNEIILRRKAYYKNYTDIETGLKL